MKIFKKLLIAGLLGLSVLPAYGTDYSDDLNRELIIACQNNDLEGARSLIESGANVNTIVDADGDTLLLKAVLNNRFHIVRLLLEKGAAVDIPGKYGETALMMAIINEQKAFLDLLLANNADVNIVSEEGITPLMLAANRGNVEILNTLLQAGADFNAVNDKGYSASDIARINNHPDIVRAISDHATWMRPERQEWLKLINRSSRLELS